MTIHHHHFGSDIYETIVWHYVSRAINYKLQTHYSMLNNSDTARIMTVPVKRLDEVGGATPLIFVITKCC